MDSLPPGVAGERLRLGLGAQSTAKLLVGRQLGDGTAQAERSAGGRSRQLSLSVRTSRGTGRSEAMIARPWDMYSKSSSAISSC